MSSHCASPEVAKRRSERLMLEIPIVVHGQSSTGESFHEHTSTRVVNAHGALIGLSTPVQLEQVVTVEHAASESKLESRVVFSGGSKDGKTNVGIEFLTPDPDFWNVDFPPVSWRPED